MTKFQSKDFYIFKIRYYADRRTLNKWRERGLPGLPRIHHQRATEFVNFKWKFIEHVTKKNHEEHWKMYMMETTECVFEDLVESHKILTLKGEGYFELLIPVENIDLIKWVEINLNLPFRKMKKTSSFYFESLIKNIRTNTWQRERSMEFAADQLQKWFIAENTRKILIEKRPK